MMRTVISEENELSWLERVKVEFDTDSSSTHVEHYPQLDVTGSVKIFKARRRHNVLVNLNDVVEEGNEAMPGRDRSVFAKQF